MLPFQTHPGLIVKVIQAVVVPSESAVCNPDVTCLSVKKRVKVIYVLIYFSTPLISVPLKSGH